MPGASGKHRYPRRTVTSPHWTDLDAIARRSGTTGAALAAELIRVRVETDPKQDSSQKTTRDRK